MQQDLVVLDAIPFRFDEGRFCADMRLQAGSPSLPAAQALLARAVPLVRPKAVCRVCYIDGEDRGEDSVSLQGVHFRSRVLAENLAGVDRVFAYVATCGAELEQIQSASTDLLTQFWLDGLKEMALGCAREALREHLGRRFGLDPAKLSSMNPGSGNRTVWPISQQVSLFRLLGDVEGAVGVRLTDSFLMTPNKTVSGILFPTEVPFESCQLCTRTDCPRRRAPYRADRDATPVAPSGHP